MHPNTLRGQRLREALEAARKEFGETKPTRSELAEAAGQKCGKSLRYMVGVIHRLKKAKRHSLDLKKDPRYSPKSDEELLCAVRGFLSEGKRRYRLNQLWTLAPKYALVSVRRMRQFLSDMDDERRRELGFPRCASYKTMHRVLIAARATFTDEKPTFTLLCARAAELSEYSVSAIEKFTGTVINETHKKRLDLRVNGNRYAEFLEAAQEARKKFKKPPTLMQLAEVAALLAGATASSFYTNFLCTALKVEDELALKFAQRKTFDSTKLPLMFEARTTFCGPSKPNRIAVAKKAAKMANISVDAMILFARNRLSDDSIRALDLKGEGTLSVRKKPVPGRKVHEVFKKYSSAPKEANSKLYNSCFVAVYKLQLQPSSERTIARVAAEAKMSEKNVQALFAEHADLERILHGYAAAKSVERQLEEA